MMGPLIDENGSLITDETETCDVLKTFFSSAFSMQEQEDMLLKVKFCFRRFKQHTIEYLNIEGY